MNSTVELPAMLGTTNRPPKASDQKYCHSCGYVLHHSAASCPSCGATQPGTAFAAADMPLRSLAPAAALLPQHVYCRGCGAGIHETAPTCPKCGAPQDTVQRGVSAGSAPNKVTAAVLALVLGGVGAHKFYLGSIFLGLLYLVFCWTFIPAIVGFVEGIYYLTLSDADFARKY